MRQTMIKFQKVSFGIAGVSAMFAALFVVLDGGGFEIAMSFFMLAAILAVIYGIIVLGEIDTKQQTQIDDLKRELEEMKQKMNQ